MIKLKRIYQKPSKKDGTRIFVERLWPRGMTKEAASLDLWLKEIAPSPELRRWFGHKPERWKEFQKRYRNELKNNQNSVKLLLQKNKKRTVTLIYAARDEEHNAAVVLKEFLEQVGQN